MSFLWNLIFCLWQDVVCQMNPRLTLALATKSQSVQADIALALRFLILDIPALWIAVGRCWWGQPSWCPCSTGLSEAGRPSSGDTSSRCTVLCSPVLVARTPAPCNLPLVSSSKINIGCFTSLGWFEQTSRQMQIHVLFSAMRLRGRCTH